MKFLVLFIVALLGVNTMIEARDMTDKEAQERAQIVTYGGD